MHAYIRGVAPAAGRHPFRGPALAAAALLALAAGAAPAGAQEAAPDTAAADTLKPIPLSPITVTATRQPKPIFETAAPVSVLDTAEIRAETPNTAADLLTDLPGLDVNGVGANQARPSIRGLRGQRILLLEDGLRLNNARRQSDFGEIPALVDINAMQRVEVVRGPASVLYGSDAIGGVVNLIASDPPPLAAGDVFGGRARFVYRDAGEQLRPGVELWGRSGRLGFRFSGSYRDTDPYEAPSGEFGEIRLDDDVTVNDTGVRDQNYAGTLDWSFDPDHRVFGKFELYRADDAGFGFVSNEALGQEDAPFIQILYPEQGAEKATLGYRGQNLRTPVADRLEVTGFFLNNERELAQNIFIPFGPPGAGLDIRADNFTDLETLGVRAEAAKLVADRFLVTYGLDYYRDDSENTDRTVTTVLGFGPPQTEVDETPNVPNATYERLGVFGQVDMQLHDRVSLIVGGRFQDVRSETDPTPGLDLAIAEHDDQTVVGAANLLVEATRHLNLVATVGRGFRSPNLVELFFNGPTPEGSGFQVRNPELKAETSLNFDVGLKYRRANVGFEAYYFRNEVENGIRISPTGEMVGPFPAFQNVNVDELRYHGVELAGEYSPLDGLTLTAGYTWLDAEDALDENNPVADSYSSKLTGEVSYRDPGDRFWGAWEIRHQGEQKDAELVIGSLIGDVVPSFTVQNVRAGVKLFHSGRFTNSLQVSVLNLTDELYAEFSNATFFRPEPKRTLLVSWITNF